MEEDRGDISEEVRDYEDELHAWCLLEERERAVARSYQQEIKIEGADESLLSFENNSGVPPGKIIEVKDTWVNVRATIDTGAAGHVMPAEMFPRAQQRNSLQQLEKESKTCVRRPYHSSPRKECTGASNSEVRTL